jgi:hypothetical protein
MAFTVKSRKPVTSNVTYWPGSIVQPSDPQDTFTAYALTGKRIKDIPPDPGLLATYRSFPSDPRAKLQRILEFVERNPKGNDQKHKLATEMYAFVASSGLAPIGGPVILTLTANTKRDAQRSPANVMLRVNNEILTQWDNMIQHALSREPVHIVPDHISTVLAWSPTANRFVEETWFPQGYETAAVRALGKLLVDYGHLVKECPAPKFRGKLGETCETLFVANRPNRMYCSGACQSRATTSRSRPRKQIQKKKPK